MTVASPVLAIAHQIGSGRAISPVIQVLRDRSVPFFAASCGLAAAAFEEAGIPFSRFDVPEEMMMTRAEQLIDSVDPALVLTGTSSGVTFEKVVLESAKKRGIPTIGVLDHWSNYLMRFEGPNGIGHYFPSLLAVMDDTARRDLLTLGYSDGRIRITGQPAFDQVIAFSARDRFAVRRQFGLGDDEHLLVFVSEPVRRDDGDALGYHETDVLRMVLQIVDRLPRPKPRVIVKPHPTETTEDLEAVVSASTCHSEIMRHVNARELVFAADVVIGMTSLLLLEATVMGTPAISIQPGEAVKPQFVGNRLGVTHAAGNQEAAEMLVRELLLGDVRYRSAARAREALHVDGRACERVADLLMRTERQGL